MTEEVLEWLPVEATACAPVKSAIEGGVADWCEHWFAGRRVRVAGLTPTPKSAPASTDEAGWRLFGQSVAISYPKKAATRLLEWALDVELERIVLTDVDRQLMQAFERRLIGDLAVRLETALGVGGGLRDLPANTIDPLGRLGGLVVSLADGQGLQLLSLGIPLATVLPLCKSSSARVDRQPVPLDRLMQALGPVTVSVDAMLGKAEITLSDLQGLSAGDVLILDVGLDDLARLTLPSSDSTIAHAKLIDVEGHRALALQA